MDTENQLLQQELNETRDLLLKYQMDLQSHLSYKVKNTENVFSFKRIENVNKDVNFYIVCKIIFLGHKKN